VKILSLDGNLLLDVDGANLRGANLYKANLRGADLYKASLYGANLREADLRGANLYKADLRGADLYKANLRGAYLRGAYLREANLLGATVIDAGQDARGYRFVAVQHDDGPMIAAGCRWLTLAEALEHWSGESTNGAECRSKIELIAAVAAQRGWCPPKCWDEIESGDCDDDDANVRDVCEAALRTVEPPK
jgi:uncharacterized protein YjbI with pentapeptide repeats